MGVNNWFPILADTICKGIRVLFGRDRRTVQLLLDNKAILAAGSQIAETFEKEYGYFYRGICHAIRCLLFVAALNR